MVKKFVMLMGVSVIGSFYTTFILVSFWSWFVVSVFHVSDITFWTMYGLTMLVALIQQKTSSGSDDLQFKILVAMLTACIPADKQEEVNKTLADLEKGIWMEGGTKIFGRFVSDTVTFGLGFVVHVLASS